MCERPSLTLNGWSLFHSESLMLNSWLWVYEIYQHGKLSIWIVLSSPTKLWLFTQKSSLIPALFLFYWHDVCIFIWRPRVTDTDCFVFKVNQNDVFVNRSTVFLIPLTQYQIWWRCFTIINGRYCYEKSILIALKS